MFRKFIFTAAICALCLEIESAGPPELTLYSEINEGGLAYTTTEAQYNLAENNFDDLTKSFCGVGLWMLYEDIDFRVSSDFVHTFASYYGDCENFDLSSYDQVSSVRYAGIEDLDYSTLTMYQQPNLCGTEYLIARAVDDLLIFDNAASSFAVTGPSSWTIYVEKGYTGGSSCIEPAEINGIYYGIYDVTDLGFDDDRVSSIRKGCYSTNVVKYIPK